MTARTEIVAGLLSMLASFQASNPTLLRRSFRSRPPSLVTDLPCAYIDVIPETVSYDNSIRDRILSPSIVFVDRLSDNGEVTDRFLTLVDTFGEFLDHNPYLASGNAVWSDGAWSTESATLGGDGDPPNATAARFTFTNVLFKSARSYP